MASTNPNLGYDFSGKRVLVTGGGRGIGKAIAEKFLELNATVVVLDKEVDLLNALVAEHPKITAIHVDLLDWEGTRKAVASVLPIHHLVNNAATVPSVAFLDMDVKHIDLVLGVNFKAALNVSLVVAKGIIEHEIKDSTVVIMSSIADEIVMPTTTFGAYNSSKAALSMLTKTMAVELAPHGIRVNCIRPGMVKTEVFSSFTPEVEKEICGTALQRMLFHKPVEPMEVANAILFLSSPLSTSITGTKITVDQGATIQ